MWYYLMSVWIKAFGREVRGMTGNNHSAHTVAAPLKFQLRYSIQILLDVFSLFDFV